MEDTTLDTVRDQLLRRAYLYGDPAAFVAGVDAALTVIAQEQHPTVSADTDLPRVLSATR